VGRGPSKIKSVWKVGKMEETFGRGFYKRAQGRLWEGRGRFSYSRRLKKRKTTHGVKRELCNNKKKNIPVDYGIISQEKIRLEERVCGNCCPRKPAGRFRGWSGETSKNKHLVCNPTLCRCENKCAVGKLKLAKKKWFEKLIGFENVRKTRGLKLAAPEIVQKSMEKKGWEESSPGDAHTTIGGGKQWYQGVNDWRRKG